MSTGLAVAGVGAGYFSRFHYDSWRRMGRARLVGVCDRDLARAEASGAPAFGALAEMLRAVRPDLLDVVVPPAAQAAVIREALSEGVRAFICQKPFCQGLDEAIAIAAEIAAAGAILVVHENFRFQPWYRRMREAIDAGQIGTPHQASFRLRPGDGQGPRAYLDRQPYFQQMPRFLVRETGVHWIDTFRFLFGAPVAVFADLRRLNPAIAGEDAGYVLLEHQGGVRTLFDANRHLDHAADNLRRTMGEALVEGTRGTLTLTGDGVVALRAFWAREVRVLLGPDRHEGFGGDCVHALQSHVVAGLLDGGVLENRVEDYLEVLRVEEAVYRSAAEGRRLRLTGT